MFPEERLCNTEDRPVTNKADTLIENCDFKEEGSGKFLFDSETKL